MSSPVGLKRLLVTLLEQLMHLHQPIPHWSHFLMHFQMIQQTSLTVNRFGNFTVYFKALPPPVPAQYWASLFTVVVTALVGSLLIPAVVGWIKSKKQTSRLNSFHRQMALVYGDSKPDENDTNQLSCIK